MIKKCSLRSVSMQAYPMINACIVSRAWTLEGRVLVLGNYQREQFGYAKGQADLVLRKDGKWFLLVSVNVPDGTPIPKVDLGTTNLAVTDDGAFSGDTVENVRLSEKVSSRKRLPLSSKARDPRMFAENSLLSLAERAGFAEIPTISFPNASLRRLKTLANTYLSSNSSHRHRTSLFYRLDLLKTQPQRVRAALCQQA